MRKEVRERKRDDDDYGSSKGIPIFTSEYYSFFCEQRKIRTYMVHAHYLILLTSNFHSNISWLHVIC